MEVVIASQITTSAAAKFNGASSTIKTSFNSCLLAIAGARRLLAVRNKLSLTDTTAAPASAFFWRTDYWNAAGDVSNPAAFNTQVPHNLVQVAELALVEYDAAAKRLYIYQPKDPAAMTATERTAAGTVWTWTDLSKSSNLTVFKSLSYVQKKVLSEGVAGVVFNMPTVQTGGRPLVEFTLAIPQTGGNTIVYSVASLRAPAPRPS